MNLEQICQLAECQPHQIEKVYSGKEGCMCGCLGKYCYAGKEEFSRSLKNFVEEFQKRTVLEIEKGRYVFFQTESSTGNIKYHALYFFKDSK